MSVFPHDGLVKHLYIRCLLIEYDETALEPFGADDASIFLLLFPHLHGQPSSEIMDNNLYHMRVDGSEGGRLCILKAGVDHKKTRKANQSMQELLPVQ